MQEAGNTLKDRLEAKNYTVGKVVVKFVGLYDTVASYGVVHKNDTEDLHLDAISIAEKVVQLAAAEEHRDNFRLTNINSAGSKGREIFLPGVHSDVGGGYADIEHEKNWELFDQDLDGNNPWRIPAQLAAIKRERQWLVASGWYRAGELSTNIFNELKGTRLGIPNTYSRIPLHLMADFARENGVPIAATLETKHPIPSDLSTVNSEIRAYIKCTYRSFPGDWFKTNPEHDRAWHVALRHDYLHFSARYGDISNAPHWSGNDPVNGHRERSIQDG